MNNQYDSLFQTMLGMDAYNLPMPVTPPTDLVIPFGSFSDRYLSGKSQSNTPFIGFNRQDNPYIRSLALFSNMADGLVDISANHSIEPFSFSFGLDRLGPPMSGLVANVAGTNVLTGDASAKFTTELSFNLTIVWMDDNNVIRIGKVASIIDDQNLTLQAVTANTGMFTGDTTFGLGHVGRVMVLQDVAPVTLQVPSMNQLFTKSTQVSDVSKIRPIGGISTFPSTNVGAAFKRMVVLGRGTRYLRDVTVGQYVRYGVGIGQRTMFVSAVISDTEMHLYVPIDTTEAPAGFNYPGFSGEIGWVDDILGLRMSVNTQLSFSTISIDPGFGPPTAKRLSFHVAAEIEHSFEQTGFLF